MSRTLSAIILGAFILMAAVVIASPDLAPAMADFALTILKWVCIAVVVIVVIIGAVIIFLWWHD